MIRGLNSLLKFDDKILELSDETPVDGGTVKSDNFNCLYVAKSDKSGWVDDEEMNKATETGTTTTGAKLVYYFSLSELRNAGYTCVGILMEGRYKDNAKVGGFLAYQAIVNAKVKDDYSLAGKVAQICESSTYWSVGDMGNASVPSRLDIQNGTATMPVATATDIREDYVKATYDSEGNYTGGHTGDYNIGDSLYITPYKASITKTIANTTLSGSAKDSYYVDNGQDYVDFSLTPKLKTYAETTGTTTTTVTVVDRIPDGTSYVAGSAYYGGTYSSSGIGTTAQGNYQGTVNGGTSITPIVGTDSDGHTTLTFTLDDVTVGDELGNIYFTLKIDKSLIAAGSTAQFTNNCYIETSEYKPNLIVDANGNYSTTRGDAANAGFSATKTSSLSLIKTAEHIYNDATDPITYSMKWNNTGVTSRTNQVMMDTLPVNGIMGSSYDGSYTVTAFSLKSLPEGMSYSDYKVYYTTMDMTGTDANTGAATLKGASDYDADAITSSSDWTAATVGTDGTVTGVPTNATAIAIIGDLPKASTVEASITVQPAGAKSNNAFVNKISINDGEGTGTAYIASRNLSGTTWIDTNKNGQIDSNEDKLTGVTATLINKSDYAAATTDIKNIKNYAVTNLDGSTCQTTTNEKGYYSFTNLIAGDYIVVFTSTDGGTQLGNYTLTTVDAANVNDSVNSKATGTSTGSTLDYADIGNTTDDINMPKAADMTSNPYWDNYNNAGFCIADPTKSYSETTAAGSDNSQVKEGDTITYVLDYANTTGKMQDITVTDTLSTGLTFNNDAVYSDANASITQDKTAKFDGDGSAAVTWTVKNVAAGTSGTITYTATVNKEAVTSVGNSYELTFGNSSKTYSKTLPNPLSHKTYSEDTAAGADGAQVKAGDVITYRVSYENVKDTEAAVKIVDTMSNGLTYNKDAKDSNGNAITDITGLTWEFTAAANTSGYVEYSATVDSDAVKQVDNTATMQYGNETAVQLETLTNPIPGNKTYDASTTAGADNSAVKVGDDITYDITYANSSLTDGEQKAANVSVTDTLSKGLTYKTGSSTVAGTAVEPEVTVNNDGTTTLKWSISNVAYGDAGVIKYTATVNADAVLVDTVTNSASVKVGNNDVFELVPLTNPVPHKTYSDATAAGADGSQVKIGDVITYRVSYNNIKNTAQTVKIVDTMSTGLTYNKDAKDSNGEVINESIASGTSYAMTWTFTAAANTSGYVEYSATVNSDAVKKVDNSATMQFGTEPSVQLEKLVNPVPEKTYSADTENGAANSAVAVGDDITYDVTYGNGTLIDGKQTAADVTIIDTLSKGLTYKADSATAGGKALEPTVVKNDDGTTTLTWTISQLAYGETGELVYTATVNSDAVTIDSVNNSATVTVGQTDKSVLTPVANPVPHKEYSENTAAGENGSQVKAGDVITYKVTYENVKNTEATVKIVDTMSDGLTYNKDAKDSNGNTITDTTGLTWEFTAAANTSGYVEYSATVNAAAAVKVDNTATMQYGNEPAVQLETLTNPIPTEPVKDVFQSSDTTTSIDGKEVQPGDELTYSIKYTNTTGADVTAVITDQIPAHTTYVTDSADKNGTEANGTVTWNVSIKNGESETVTFKVTVDENVEGAAVENTGKVKVGNNEYSTNTTTNTTPTLPAKDVFQSTDTTTSIDGNAVQPGDVLTYKITYTNTTGADGGILISDAIPEHTAYVENSADYRGVYEAETNTVQWALDVANGDSVTVSFNVKVDADVNGEVIENTGKVNDGTNEYTTNTTKNPTPTGPVKDVFQSTDTTTSIDGKEVQPGDVLTYSITYTNTTGKDGGVLISDEIPVHTSYVDGSADKGGLYEAETNTVQWAFDVADGESVTVTFNVKVDDDTDGDPLLNTAKTYDGNNEYYTNTTINPTPTQPVKDVFQSSDTTTSIDGKEVQPNDELTYSITYTNTTGKDGAVAISDAIPEHTTYVEGSADNNGVYDAETNTVQWALDAAEGESVTVTFNVKVDADVNGELIENIGKVNDGTNEYTTNITTNPTPTQPVKDVFQSSDTTTSIDGKAVQPNDELTYSITYTNTTGKDGAVAISDSIPAHTTYVTGSADNEGVYDPETNTVQWAFDAANGESITVTFKVKVDADVNGELIENTGKVNDGTNEYTTNTTKNPTPTKPEKTVSTGTSTTNIDGEEVQQNDELTYTIKYTNTTGADVTANITDAVPAHTTYVADSADNNGTESNGTVSWSIELKDGESVTVSFKVKVDADTTGAVLDNTATVNDGNNTYNTNTVTNPTPTQPVKTVTKGSDTTNIDGTTVDPNDQLTYSITYTNTTGTDRNVTITDAIPAHTAYVGTSADNGGTYENGIVTWNVDVKNGESITVSFTVAVDSDVDTDEIINTASVYDGTNSYATNTTKNTTPMVVIPDTSDSSNIMFDGFMMITGMMMFALGLMFKKKYAE